MKNKGLLKKILCGFSVAITLCISGGLLASCGKNDGNNRNNIWSSGIEAPTKKSKVGNYYFDEDDGIVYKYTNNGWEVLNHLIEKGEEEDHKINLGTTRPNNVIDGELYIDVSTFDFYARYNGSWNYVAKYNYRKNDIEDCFNTIESNNANNLTINGITEKGEKMISDTGMLIVPKTIKEKNIDTIASKNLTVGQGLNGNIYRLKTLIILDNVESINDAFVDCNKLNSVYLPSSVKEIGDFAFYGCTSLQTFNNLENLETIGEKAFAKSGINSIKFSNNLQSVGNFAFSECNNLVEITIPRTLTNIGDGIFYHCTDLKKAIFQQNSYYIPNYTFEGCSKLETVELPFTIQRIGEKAFYECVRINIILPQNLQIIGSEAFFGCTGISSLRLPSHLTTINSNAFSNCSNMSKLWVANGSNINLGSDCFKGCSAIREITVENESFMNIENLTISQLFENTISIPKIFALNSLNISNDYCLEVLNNFHNYTCTYTRYSINGIYYSVFEGVE